jgi:hypothetical protein
MNSHKLSIRIDPEFMILYEKIIWYIEFTYIIIYH